MPQIEEKLRQMGLTLPDPAPPAGNYVPGVRTGNLVFLSGVGPGAVDGTMVRGKVGRDLTAEQAQEAARLCALHLLANLKTIIGDLDRVRRIVKVLGMVNSDPQFREQPRVINGCSDLLVALYGERGRHARAAVGMAALPNQIAVEVEMVVEVEE
jgi:enamine deaminase RidA (YjgF/YER057c/UK114 family)